MKLQRIALACIGALMAVASFSMTPAMATALSSQQLGVVANNCYVGQVGLQHLRRTDVVLRINLGNLYGAVIAQASAFTTRLGNDNIKSKAISAATSAMNTDDTKFQNDFNSYAVLLENGLSLDCSNNPQQFYNILAEAQEAREDTNQDVQNLNKDLTQYIQALSAIKPSSTNGGSQ